MLFLEFKVFPQTIARRVDGGAPEHLEVDDVVLLADDGGHALVRAGVQRHCPFPLEVALLVNVGVQPSLRVQVVAPFWIGMLSGSARFLGQVGHVAEPKHRRAVPEARVWEGHLETEVDVRAILEQLVHLERRVESAGRDRAKCRLRPGVFSSPVGTDCHAHEPVRG